jgi:hypothetical protein
MRGPATSDARLTPLTDTLGGFRTFGPDVIPLPRPAWRVPSG